MASTGVAENLAKSAQLPALGHSPVWRAAGIGLVSLAIPVHLSPG